MFSSYFLLLRIIDAFDHLSLLMSISSGFAEWILTSTVINAVSVVISLLLADPDANSGHSEISRG